MWPPPHQLEKGTEKQPKKELATSRRLEGLVRYASKTSRPPESKRTSGFTDERDGNLDGFFYGRMITTFPHVPVQALYTFVIVDFHI
jgi:hypothetical protein